MQTENMIWPGGRTNHYWFDLNRDWLLLQHPESVGRIEKFHEWKPNVLTDAHEMGTNNTYFFQPGIPSRNNPLTPKNTFDLTHSLADYHAEALDSIGSLYYSQESFDDFYIGKGSTYPDLNGCVGILFEQASSRGHLQHSSNGLVSFPFTIRNQLNTALSTLKGALALKKNLLKHQQYFYDSALKAAKKDKTKGYIFGDDLDESKTNELVRILQGHKVTLYPIDKDYKQKNGVQFKKGSAYYVPYNQAQYRLIKSMFEEVTTFTDSLFYDVSTWTLPLAFNIPSEAVGGKTPSLGDQINTPVGNKGMIVGDTQNVFAYLIEWKDYYTSKLLYQLLNMGVNVKVATDSFNAKTSKGDMPFGQGTLLVSIGNQKKKENQITRLLQAHYTQYSGKAYAIQTGLTSEGIDLGSPSFKLLKMPKAALIVGEGVYAYEAGEVWHLLDQRLGMPLTLLDIKDISSTDLQKYNVLIMVGGNYGMLSKERIRAWVSSGGTLIAQKGGSKWLVDNAVSSFRIKSSINDVPVNSDHQHHHYNSISKKKGAQVIGGAIFETTADLSHPLLYGFEQNKIPVFRNHKTFYQLPKNPHASPLRYTQSPLLSGYISKKNLNQLKNTPALLVGGAGQGRMICFVDNPNFRAFWFGTNKLFLNALFFGHLIDSRSTE